MKIYKLIERILPFTVISSKNKKAEFPGWIIPKLAIYTKNKVYLIGRKVNNLYDIKIYATTQGKK